MKSFKKVVFAAMAIAVASLGIQPALAHHSGAGFGKDTKEISGTVKEFQFMNPHSWIQVYVTDASGKMVEWSVEWGSPNQLGREGIRPSTFAPGSKVTMKVHPMANGSPIASFIGAKMADGSTIGKWDGGE
ncbi:MAG: DUF6152 family protein [Bryobacteraceae bacterium]|jgi:hypothetical protein